MLAFTLRRALSGHRRHDRCRDHRVFDVPLRRRSREPDRFDRHLGGRTRGGPQVARPRRSRAGAVRAAISVNAAQFKFGVSYQFRQPVSTLLMERMPATLELAICATVLAMVFGILMGVYSALQARHHACQNIPGGVADRDIAADLPDRHPADLPVRGDAGLAAVVRPRRGRPARLVDDGTAHDLRPEGADHAFDHAGPVPDDADHAAGAR